MLCQHCSAILKETPVLDTDGERRSYRRCVATIEFDSTFASVESAAIEGCYICRAIRRTILSDNVKVPRSVDLRLQYNLHMVEDWKTGNSQLYVCSTTGTGFRAVTVLTLSMVQNNAKSAVTQITTSSTQSEDTARFVRSSMTECMRNHVKCSKNLSEPLWYPTRLLELQSSASKVTLIETSEKSACGPYATLSHSWGGADIFALRKDTIEEMKRGIDILQLLPTFVQALDVARSLNMKWIWIDSLCILQDSLEDWAKEAGLMKDVYQNAVVNIAATNSVNSYGGVYSLRIPAALENPVVTILNGVTNGCFVLFDVDYYRHQVDKGPLNSRAWVVQERLMSSRIIHFAHEQVFWDCYEMTSCESFPQGFHQWVSPQADALAMSRKVSGLFQDRSVEESIGAWGKIVGAYISSGLSFERDRVVAISGIAGFIGQKMHVEYHAGLWKTKMEMQMCWLLEESATKSPVATFRRAPSWSWFSVTGKVNYPEIGLYADYDVRLLAAVEDVRIEQQIDEQEGLYISGSLWLRCILNTIRIARGEAKGFAGLLAKFIRQVSWDHNFGLEDGTELYLVPLFEVAFGRSSEIRGIIIQRVSGDEQRFMRCGHVFIANGPGDEDEGEDGYSSCKSAIGKKSLASEGFDEEKGHLIELM